jgi:group II intron reverse transcriptase/maturase
MELLEEILSRKNLNDAYLQVYRNKGASGVDGVTVEDSYEYLKDHKEELLEQIRTRKYQPQPVRRVQIPKDNGKMRNLGIPTVIDRVIQQAISQVLTPIYEEQFSNSSYGFRPNRSCEMAIIRSLELNNDGYDWVVDIDLERFFDTVHHDRLMNIISRTIKDGDVISLIRKFLVSGVMVQGIYEDTTIGTPQGGNLSPLLSNIMLNELDKELEARGLNFVRYADDCNIFVGSKKAAERVMQSITTFIEKKLGLIVNASKSKIAKPTEIKFLGYGYYFDTKANKYKPKPHLKSIQKLQRKIKQLTKRSWSIDLDYRFLKLKQLLTGWINYFRIANMKLILSSLDANIRRKIRVVIWKQWKKVKTKYKALRQLGINHRDALATANARKGYYHVAHTRVIEGAISHERLKKRGLVSALDHYLKVHIVI